MKFLTKINRNFLLLLTLILLVFSVAGYCVLHAIVTEDTQESLLQMEAFVIKQIEETGEIPNIYPTVEVKRLMRPTMAKPEFKEVFIQDEIEDELEEYLEYARETKIGSSYYLLKLRQSTFENKDLVMMLSLYFLVLLASAFGISFLITAKMNKTVWNAFEINLRAIERFSFNAPGKLALAKTNIREFDRLNQVVGALTQKLATDYLTLKQFTENASHEIQTPLSIALINLDEMLQQPLPEEFFKKVITSINALKRLSALNQSLVLLTKIQNRQFASCRVINLTDVLKQKVNDFEPLLTAKNLTLNWVSDAEFVVKMDEQISDILVSNLLSNASKHNLPDGRILVNITKSEFKICNTGQPNNLTNETIFERFTKGNSISFGLGLAIVKNICETHRLAIHYIQNDWHCFTIARDDQNNSNENHHSGFTRPI
jgi:signal transduction histidine kinase